jgi:predicted ABC-class ATPase
MGGSGDYFEHADTVIVMDSYLPSDQTQAAHAIAAQHATTSAALQGAAPGAAAAAAQQVQGSVRVTPRVPRQVYAAGQDDYRGVKTHVRGLHQIQVCSKHGVATHSYVAVHSAVLALSGRGVVSIIDLHAAVAATTVALSHSSVLLAEYCMPHFCATCSCSMGAEACNCQ